MAFDWGKALQWIVPAGASVGGAVLGARAQNQQNDRLQDRTDAMDQMARDQMNRQNAYSNLVLPSLLQALGRKDPALLKQVAAGGGNPPGVSGSPMSSQPQTPQMGLVQPGQPSSGLLGRAGGGAGIGALAGGPIGAAVGAGVGAISSLFGGGRRAADSWTQTTQNDFGAKVAGIIDPFNAAQSAGTLTDDARKKAQDDFRNLLAQYTATANQYGGSGSQQKRVIDQMWRQFNGPGYIPDWKRTLGLEA